MSEQQSKVGTRRRQVDPFVESTCREAKKQLREALQTASEVDQAVFAARVGRGLVDFYGLITAEVQKATQASRARPTARVQDAGERGEGGA